MPTKLDSYMIQSPDLITMTDEYNVFIESLVILLKNDPSTRSVYISPETGYLYRFDLTGFLLASNVALEDHRLVMRLNGLNDTHAMDENLNSLLVPDESTVARLKQVYRTSLTVS